MTAPALKNVSAAYGAPMGRQSIAHPGNEYRVYVHELRLDSGGYDKGGAYWGIGSPLFRCVSADGEFVHYLRASSRIAAIAALRDDFPNLTFYRS